MNIEQIESVDKQISLCKVGVQTVFSLEAGSVDYASTNAYSGQGYCRGKNNDDTSIPDSSNTKGKVKKLVVAHDILGNPLSKPDGSPLMRAIYVTPRQNGGNTNATIGTAWSNGSGNTR